MHLLSSKPEHEMDCSGDDLEYELQNKMHKDANDEMKLVFGQMILWEDHMKLMWSSF